MITTAGQGGMRTTVQALIDRLAGMRPDEQIIASVMTIDDVLDRMGIDEQREELLHLNAHSFAGQVLDSYHRWVICRHHCDEMSELDDFQQRCDRIVEELDEAIDSAIAKGREGGDE